MRLVCSDTEAYCEFESVPLHSDGDRYTDVFAQKNNKTLGQTLEHQRYAKFKTEVMSQYRDFLDVPLGEFLLGLKHEGDNFYTRFLNRYGDLEYSTFVIADEKYLNDKGVYAYLAGDELKYIGRCRDSMKKRINQGYGKIHPKNCYLDGQATNCHLNARITASAQNISLWLSSMEFEEIEVREQQLIRRHNPPWNIQRA